MKKMVNEAFDSPVVRRIDVLERVKLEVKAFDDDTYFAGLCPLLDYALWSYDLLLERMSIPARRDAIKKFFPLYTYDNAVKFGAGSDEHMSKSAFWWPPFQWDDESGRMRFLNWLIEQYKDDETDLRTL